MAIEKKFENDAEYNHKHLIWVTLNDLLKSAIEYAGRLYHSAELMENGHTRAYRVAGAKVAVEAMGMDDFFDLTLKQMDDMLVMVFGIYMTSKYGSGEALGDYLDDLMKFLNETRQVDF